MDTAIDFELRQVEYYSLRRESVGVSLAFEIADDVCAYNKYRSNMCNQITGPTSRGDLAWHFFFFFFG